MKYSLGDGFDPMKASQFGSPNLGFNTGQAVGGVGVPSVPAIPLTGQQTFGGESGAGQVDMSGVDVSQDAGFGGNFLWGAEGGPQGLLGGKGSGLNFKGLGMVAGGLQTLGNIWNSYQQTKMAKEQLAFSKQAFATQLGDQRQTYNSALNDRARSRAAMEGQTSEQRDTYLDEHQLG